MADRSNPGQRILGARRTTRGPLDSLETLVGIAMVDGAQCFVIEEQANYRYLAASDLPADGKLVVAPLGNRGRFIRESGLVGLALLEDGALTHNESGLTKIFTGYQHTKLVQFELDKDTGSILYIGNVPRVALLFASTYLRFVQGTAELYIRLNSQGKVVASSGSVTAGYAAASGTILLMPGDKLSLCTRVTDATEGDGSLRVVLV